MTEEINKEEEVNPKKGKGFSLEAYKASFPDSTEDPDDETLHDFQNNRYADLQGKYDSLNGANDRLNKLVTEDPNLGILLSKIAGDKPQSLPSAIAETYGKDFFENSEEFEQGYQEFLKEESRKKEEAELANKNFSEITMPRLEKFASDNQLNENQVSEIYAGLETLAKSFLMGDVSEGLIDLVYKGLNYEKDIQDAADTGYVEGKNEKVEAKMKESEKNPIPNMGNGSGSGKVNPKPQGGKKNFYSEFN